MYTGCMPRAANLIEDRSRSDMPPELSRRKRQLAVAEGRKDVRLPRSCCEKFGCSAMPPSSTCMSAAACLCRPGLFCQMQAPAWLLMHRQQALFIPCCWRQACTAWKTQTVISRQGDQVQRSTANQTSLVDCGRHTDGHASPAGHPAAASSSWL